jgi:hypothetical protein
MTGPAAPRPPARPAGANREILGTTARGLSWSAVIPGPGGTLLGTTRSGGSARACGDGGPGGVHGCGTLYKIAA